MKLFTVLITYSTLFLSSTSFSTAFVLDIENMQWENNRLELDYFSNSSNECLEKAKVYLDTYPETARKISSVECKDSGSSGFAVIFIKK